MAIISGKFYQNGKNMKTRYSVFPYLIAWPGHISP